MTTMMTIGIEGGGGEIKDLREGCGKTPQDFSASLGIPLSALWDIENNECPLTLDMMRQFAMAGKVEEVALILKCLKKAYPVLQESSTCGLLEQLVEAVEQLRGISVP